MNKTVSLNSSKLHLSGDNSDVIGEISGGFHGEIPFELGLER